MAASGLKVGCRRWTSPDFGGFGAVAGDGGSGERRVLVYVGETGGGYALTFEVTIEVIRCLGAVRRSCRGRMEQLLGAGGGGPAVRQSGGTDVVTAG